MALFTDYYCDGDSGSDSTGDGTIGSPFATAQKCIDTIDTESSSNLVTASSGEVTVHLVAGDIGTGITISGITDDATNYIRILGLTHATKVQWDVNLPFVNGGSQNAIDNGLNNTILEHIQVLIDPIAGRQGIRNTGTTILVNACVVRGADPQTTNNNIGIRMDHTSGICVVRNSFVFGIESGAGYNANYRTAGSGGTTNLYNCGGFGDNATSGFLYGFHGQSGTMNLTNCYSKADSVYNSVDSLTTSAAYDSGGTPDNLDNIALTTTNFVDPLNVTSTSRDFTLVEDTALEDGSESTNLSGIFTTDWFGNTISVWPIGPAERVGGGGGVSIPVIMNHLKNQGIS